MGLTGDDRAGAGRTISAGRRAFLAGLTLVWLQGPLSPAAWGEPLGTAVTVLALRGYDPVSYFLPEGPRPGSDRFEAAWGGQIWRFTGEANRAAFRRDPGVYGPRLGGFDAAAILDHRLADADPAVFAVIGERLYLFRNRERRGRFLAEPALARSAEAIWPSLRTLLDDPGESGPAVERPAVQRPPTEGAR